MFGNKRSDAVPAFLRRRRAAAPDFAEMTGRLAGEPSAALEQIHAAPDVSQAALAVILAAFSQSLALHLQTGVASPAQFLQKTLFLTALGLCLWVLLAAAWHGISRLFQKEGRFKPFLCLVGWAGAAFWPVLPLTLLAGGRPAADWALGFSFVFMKAAFLFLAWAGLKINYGWSSGKALLVLLFPLTLFILVAAGLAAFFALSLVSGALLWKIFL